MQRQTTIIKPQDINRKWYVVDASKLPLGRLATKVSFILSGKAKPTYTPNIDTGDYVIVINASKAILTGNKLNDKKYYNVSGFLGGLRTRSAKVMKESYPVEMVERAIWGMLPKGKLGRQMYKKLHVFAGDHNMQAQKPEEIVID